MIYTRRDLNMVIAILLVLVLGISYLVLSPRIETWLESRRTQERLEREYDASRRIIATRGQAIERLEDLRGSLPAFGANEPVGAELLRQIQRLADESRVTLTRLELGNEEILGDLREVAIDCAWEAELDSLVRLLYAVQIAGATLDMRQLTVSPAPQGTRLRGNFKIMYAFTRRPPATDGG
ncbi:MAG TPA: hypothetical protein PKE55_14120 [Kiritimatiellia bacterium]|nr:hypothetical protein [Kiritimatiellia bacterium]